jgi:YidC/Oxa1 family membrane protein insertase
MQPPLANVFQPLINVFEAILRFFHDDVGLGWGLAIIALTVLIRSLLLPLTLKQLRSMYRMAQFTPQIKKLRAKHGSDPQRLQRETLAFYKENRINPLGSVLPALAQLPVFLSLYYMLRTDLRHDICPGINPPGTSNPQPCGETAASHFLFIPDLTSRATGAVLVALIALYVGSQLFSFLLSANPTMDKRQRTIFIALPFFFITIAWQLPAGLLVYWITTNTWTIVQGAIVRKRLGHLRQAAQDAQAAVGRGGLGDRFKQLRGEDRPQATALGPKAAHQRRLDDEDPDRLGRAPQQGGLAPRGPAAASERPPAGAAPPQEQALRSTPVSGRDLRS